MPALAEGIAQSRGEGWAQIGQFGLAVLLSGLIGLEREWRQKSAGLRTHTVVGVGSALFMLVSKYGFGDVVHQGTIQLDPSRMAAQIVSGLGFIGAGVIFTHRGSVRGLTTAAALWLTAAVGAACAAGLPILAALATAVYLILTFTKPLTKKIADHVDDENDD
ncbi:MAG TPA: MgtC/SapB family protein [Actinospica sp.]|jgi:putative Mg2+ transporter-C (MgtC) family protein|nr:MgtC/SapB family protein [Actinospica sp.]